MRKFVSPFRIDTQRIAGHTRRGRFWLIIIVVFVFIIMLETISHSEGRTNILPPLMAAIVIFLVSLPMLRVSQNDVRKLANKSGWQYLGDKHFTENQTINFFTSSLTKLFRLKGEKFLTGIIRGQIRSVPFLLFRYTIKGSLAANTSASSQQFTTLVVDLPQKFPRLVINDHSVYKLEKYIDYENAEHITLEGSFGKTHTVYSPKSVANEERLLALSFLSPDVMEIYEQNFSQCSMISEGRSIAIITREDLYTKKQLDKFIESLLVIMPKVERQMRIRGAVGRLQAKSMPST